ncbi:MAG: T9SS type A sorting domain-containing protein [Crocinitomix sp.]|nr:T9SS type A sorting domain-containing protein [Crocinitomix sp.]
MHGYLTLILILLFASDSLAQWEEIDIPTTNSFYSVDIHESGICYAAGIAFVQSDDFGETWEEVDFPGPDSIYHVFTIVNDIQVLTEEVTVAVGWHISNNNNIIIRTADNGDTWTVVFSGPLGTGRQFRGVHFRDALVGVAVSDDGLAYKTTDGGITWLLTASVDNDLTCVSFVSSTNVVAGGDQKIIRSTDAGSTWSTQVHTDKYFRSLEHESTADIVTATYTLSPEDHSYLLESTNDGITWVSQYIDDGFVDCHAPVEDDSVFFGFGYDTFLGLEGGEYMYRFLDPIVEGSKGIDFDYGVGLVVTSFAAEGKVYRFDYDDPWDLEQMVDFTRTSDLCEDALTTYTPSNPTLESYEWFVDGISTSFDPIFDYTHLEPGEVLIEMVTEFEGNFDTVAHSYTILAYPTITDIEVDWGSDTLICWGDAYSFNLLDIADGTGYSVYQDGELIEYTSEFEDNRYYYRGEAYTSATFQVDKWVVNECDSISLSTTFTFILEAHPDSSNLFYALEEMVCLGDSSQIVIPSPEIGTTYVLFQDMDSIAAAISLGDPISFNTLPIYTMHGFQMEAISAAGCHSDLTTIDSIWMEPVNATFDIGLGYYYEDSLVEINTDGIIGSIFNWTVSGSPSILENTDLLHPDIAYDENGYYDLNLMVESEIAGCLDSLTDTMTIFISTPPDSTENGQCFVEEIERIVVLDQTIDPFGNLIVVGYTRVASSWWGPILGGVIQKFDSEGNLLWKYVHERYVPSHDDHKATLYNAVDTDEFGNIYFSGSFQTEVFEFRGEQLFVFPGGDPSLMRRTFVSKLNSDGEPLWFGSMRSVNGGISDVLIDRDSNNVFIAGINLSGYFSTTFHDDYYVTSDGYAGGVLVLKLSATGGIQKFYKAGSGYQTVNTGRVKPFYSYPTRSTYISPRLEMPANDRIYVTGEMRGLGNLTLDIAVLSATADQQSYMLELEPYGVDDGWTKAELNDELGPFGAGNISNAVDNDGNLYLSNSGYYRDLIWDVVNLGESTISKYDNDFNLIWDRTFENFIIRDIICENNAELFFIGSLRNYGAVIVDDEPIYLEELEDNSSLVIGSLTIDGEIQWIETLGHDYQEFGQQLCGNACGDIFFSGVSVGSGELSGTGTALEVVLSGIVYEDSIHGSFIMKLSAETCIVGGCQTLCEDEGSSPSPLIYVSGLTLSTDGYVTYQWYKDGDIIPGAIDSSYNMTELGNYTVTVTDLNGCLGESDVFLATCELEGFIPEPIITLDGLTVSTDEYVSYQWYLDGTPIIGATDQSYLCTEPGIYSVEVVSDQGCSGESAPIDLENLDMINAHPSVAYFSLFPNPTNGNVLLNYQLSEVATVTIKIMDVSGKTILTKNLEEVAIGFHSLQMNLTSLSSGTYFYVLLANDVSFIERLIISD